MKYRVPVLETFGWQEPVKSSTINIAPIAPVKGDRYIVPRNVVPANIWDGHADSIAWYDGVEWKYDVPTIGWSTFVESQLLAFTFNGTEWGVAEAGAVVTTELFVDNNRVDTYPENGSRSLPYKSVMSAVNSIITKANNSLDHAYSLYLMPGAYDETITFESSSLVNLTIKGSAKDSVTIRPTVGNSIQSNSNNDNLRKLIFEDVTLDAPVVMGGASNGTNFGAFLAFDDVRLTQNAVLQIQNSISVHFLGDTYVSSNVSLTNIGLISISNDAGMDSAGTLTIKNLPGSFMPNGVTTTFAYVYGNIVSRDIIWDLTGGGAANLNLISAVLGVSDNNDITIPPNVTYNALNSTLLGNYTYNGVLNLRGSFVTGVMEPASTGTLSMKVQSADMVSLGLPPDGVLSDGLVELADDSTVIYAIDEFNEILKDLAPPQALSLTGVVLANTRSPYTGKLPSGLSGAWYDAKSLAPGATLNNVITQNSLVLSSGTGAADAFSVITVPMTPSSTNAANFRKGDEGLLVAKHQIGAAAFAAVATLDIKANFKENPPGSTPPRPPQQDLSTWDAQGSGDACTNGVVSFNNAKGTLQVTNVRWYNNFNKWQKMNAQLNITNLDPGFNKFSLLHDMAATDEESAITELYYANDATPMTFSTSPSIVELALTSTKYLSGVRYYSTGDTFTVNYAGDDVFNNIYHPTQCSSYTFDAAATVGKQPSTPPGVNDTFTINETLTVNSSNIFDTDARLTAYFYHPYKTQISAVTATENRLINTYLATRSTDIAEYFTDEQYRMDDAAFDSVPASLTGNWDSTQIIPAGKAVVGMVGSNVPGVKAGNTDYSIMLPAGNPNYTGRAGNEVYVRGFKSALAKSSCTLTLSGLVLADVDPVGTGDVNVEIKLPGQTGWLDAGVSFSAGSFTGANGNGCRVSVAGSVWSLTFGTFSTINSGGVIMVRITFRNRTNYITSISTNLNA